MELDELMEDEQNVDEQRPGARTEAWDSSTEKSENRKNSSIWVEMSSDWEESQETVVSWEPRGNDVLRRRKCF